MYMLYRKRPRHDRDAEFEDVAVKTEQLIPGFDLVVDEDVMDTGSECRVFCFYREAAALARNAAASAVTSSKARPTVQPCACTNMFKQ